LFIALVGELSTFGLLAYPATFTIPMTRFGGFIWLISVAVTLPKKKSGKVGEAQEPEHA
jgi:hypothetical protein